MTPARPVAPVVPLPRNYLRPCLLLLLAEGTGHGYELLRQVHALGLVNADTASVYRSLRALDQEGLVRSRWEPSASGPARRTYVLTAEGRDRLRAMTDEIAYAADALDRFLDRCAGIARHEGAAR
jgi:PadR family transcriptional regulator PadR